MRLHALHLESFRSFERAHVRFAGVGEGDIQVLFGANGSGKTNILEAIALLSLAQSCLGMDPEHLIRFGHGHFRVRGEFASDAGERFSAEVVAQTEPRRQKACFLNDVRKPFARFVGTVPLLLFLPGDLGIFSGPPARRRAFLDDFLAQVSPAFTQTKLEYERVLKQRNVLLKAIVAGRGREQDLEVWDGQVALHGAAIRQARMGMLAVLGDALPAIASSLQEPSDELTLRYVCKHAEAEHASLEEELASLLLHYRQRDLLLQSTTVGPHRDDWTLCLEKHDIAHIGSRGQQRTYLLALLFAQLAHLTQMRGERPMVLLDDVFSELDDTHQRALLARLSGHQTFITTTHSPPGGTPAYAMEVSRGRVLQASMVQSV